MDIDDIIIEQLDDIVYENDYMIVHKVIKDIPTHSKYWVKRVQVVTWKKKNSDLPEIDIRRYSLKDKIYKKGISFTKRETELLKVVFENLELDKDLSIQ